MDFHFQNFKHFAEKAIELMLLDLEAMERIAETGNSLTTSTQTTLRPGDEHLHVPETPKVSRCTIPIAMICFSAIDMFGQWINKDSNKDFAHSSSAFFKQLASNEDLKNDQATQVFQDAFRHGIIHSFFAMQGFSITYPLYENNTLFIDLHGYQNTLDVKYLLSVVRSGMTSLRTALLSEQSELSQNLFEGYQRWLQKQSTFF